jgi:hypothetical protein
MKSKEFNKLAKEEQQKEIEKCKSFKYFYKNYCWKEGMPEYSEKAYKEYLEFAETVRYMIGITNRRGKAMCIREYPLTLDEAERFNNKNYG